MRAKGFTIIELLIVVGIFGILLAVTIPAYLSYTQKNHPTQNKSFQGVPEQPPITCTPSDGVLRCSDGKTYKAN